MAVKNWLRSLPVLGGKRRPSVLIRKVRAGFGVFGLAAMALSPLPGIDLVPGTAANWEPTPIPGRQGEEGARFSNERPIARWSVASHQAFGKAFSIGLVAVHGSGQQRGDEGIAKVVFVANDGQPVTVSEPSINPSTGYWEWWVNLLPGAKDGPVEVRATVYPHEGQCRVLQGGYVDVLGTGENVPGSAESLVLWSNAKGSFTRAPVWVAKTGSDSEGDGSQERPYQSIGAAVMKGYGGDVDFGTLWLGPGLYPMHRGGGGSPLNQKGWLTIEPAPGVDRSEVTIGGNDGDPPASRYRLLRFKDVSFDYTIPSPASTVKSPSTRIKVNLWLEGVSIRGQSASARFNHMFEACNVVAITKSARNRLNWSNWNSGPAAPIVLGVDVSETSGDVFSGSQLIRDWTVKGTIKLAGQHPDLWQSYGAGGNRILMDGICEGEDIQLIFFDGGRDHNTDIAVVNTIMKTAGGGQSQVASEIRHMLLWNIQLDGHRILFHERIGSCATFAAFGSIFPDTKLGSGSDPDAWLWDYNQFSSSSGQLVGNHALRKDPLYGEDLIPTRPMEVPARTVRWDFRQAARPNPSQAGAWADSRPPAPEPRIAPEP